MAAASESGCITAAATGLPVLRSILLTVIKPLAEIYPPTSKFLVIIAPPSVVKLARSDVPVRFNPTAVIVPLTSSSEIGLVLLVPIPTLPVGSTCTTVFGTPALFNLISI